MRLFRCFVISLSVLCSLVVSAKSTLSVRPQSWWVGMKNPVVQLMICGDKIGGCDVSVDSSTAVHVLKTERVSNPDYLFVYLDLTDALPGKFDIKLSDRKYSRKITYLLNERVKNSSSRQGFGQEDAVYLLMPDRFANADTSNDNVEGYKEKVELDNLHERQGGDIQGIINHLPYIADLGMTALWTTPLFDDDDVNYSYHHYASTDLYSVDPRFGSNEDFRRLVDSCHRYGLKYIMDVVPNHVNTRYKWGRGIPDSSWVKYSNTFNRTNYQLCAQTDPYASDVDKRDLIDGWFDTNMADLNLSVPLLFDYIKQAYIYWIEYTGLDGLRVDTYPYNDVQKVSQLFGDILKEYPDMTFVGECWVKSVPELSYYQSGTFNRDGFDSHLHSVIDFVLKDYLEWSFVESEGWNKGLQRFYFHFAQDFVYSRPDLIMNMVDNHDLSRYGNAVAYEPRLYKMGLAMIALVRGYPQYYYGDEIMLDGRGSSYEDCRHRFPGGWASDRVNKFHYDGRTVVENEVFDYLRTILNFRKQSDAVKYGKMKQFVPFEGVYCFFRYTDNDKVMVVVNNNAESISVDLKRFDEMGVIGADVYDVINGKHLTLDDMCDFEAKSVTVFDF